MKTQHPPFVFVQPREGVNVRDPETSAHIAAAGEFRILNTYYDRRIKDGDLLVREDKIYQPEPEIVQGDQADVPAEKDAGKAGRKKGE